MTGGIENIRLHGVVTMMRGGNGSGGGSGATASNLIMDYERSGNNELLQIGGIVGERGTCRSTRGSDKIEDPICATCSDKIIQRYLLQVNGLHYHTDCLRCCVCAVGLQGESSCFIRDGRVYCKGDYYRTYGSAQCAKCTRWISSTDWVRRARDSQAEQIYHLACFACDACHRQLSTGEEFALVEKKLLCKTHYQETVDSGEESCDNEEEHDSSSGAGGERSSTSSRSSKSKTKRVRTTFTDEQLQILQANFQIDSNPDGQDLERIAQITGLSKRVTQVWFQNSRARQKKHHVDRGSGGSASSAGKGVNQSIVPAGVMLLGSQTTPSSSSSPSQSGSPSSSLHHQHHHHHHHFHQQQQQQQHHQQLLHGHHVQQISRVLTRDSSGGGARGGSTGDIAASPTEPVD